MALKLHTVRLLLVCSVVAVLGASVAPRAHPKVYIDINAPTLRQIPLAVPALRRDGGDSGQAHLDLAETLRSDLGLVGLFEVLDPRGYLEDPQRGPLPPDAASFADWFAVGAEVLIKGRVTREGESLSVDLWAYDVLRRQILFSGRNYTAPAGEARTIAHMFANTVLEEFTGTAGPFGTRIAYTVQQGKAKELALVEMDGADPFRLTRGGSLNVTPSWSRDGRYLYYTSYLLGDPDLYLLDLATGKQWIVSRQGGIDLGGRDSPDGKDLLLVLSIDGNSEIYRMAKADRKTVRLTRNRAIDVAPTWSPDGKHVAFVSDRMGNPHIFLMDRDGGDVRRLTFARTHNGDPDWSPRGDLIAFTGMDERGVFQVYVVDPKGREERQLTRGPNDTLDPSWSPDGRFLAVTSNREGGNAIYVFRLGGQEFRRVSPKGQTASMPSWFPLFLSP
jgi:TolB protein